jgi:signal transduction histidine kinase/CheY-like chemotaxis protein/HAMP domain-containing protein
MNLILVYGLRPLQDLGRSAARLGAGDLAARVPDTSVVEIASAAHAFNTMAANLELAKAALEEREAERLRAERSRSARFAVTRVLAEAETADDVIDRLLEAVARSIEWDAGEFWRPDPDAGLLRRASAWHFPGRDASAFDVARPGLAFAPGVGVLGEVWATAKTAWADADDPAFGGRAMAETGGLASAVAFPVGGREVMGVMVFWSRQAQPADTDLMTVLGDIGGQIGQFLERREAEETLHAIEEQLRQAQKMEAIGKLAGGVAHDFNNLLTVIIGRCGLLVSRIDPPNPVRHDLELIQTTADRAAALTRQLLAFGRKQVLQPRALDLNVVVEDIVPMLRRLIGEDVQLTVRLRPEIGYVMADPSQVEQVIVNLVVNARDAMPHGGQLTIETTSVDLDAGYVRRHPGTSIGPHVVLSVSDTGVGMDEDTQARVFEPFFTTKEAGKGSGLGLATVYGIVKQSGGAVWVYSEPGRGSVFKVYLRQVETITEARAPGTLRPETPGGSETILIVEDQLEVRELAADILTSHGYAVLTAGDAKEAATVFAEHRDEIDMLLTDVVMPGASGRQLADSLTAMRPGIKVLYMSGYTDQAIVNHGVLEAGIAYLEKPFTIPAITRAVRDVLDARPVAARA